MVTPGGGSEIVGASAKIPDVGRPRMRQGGYLFAENATIHDVVEAQRRSAKKTLEDLPSRDILARPIDELVAELIEKFRLDVPVLDREHIVEFLPEEVDVDISHDPARVIMTRGPHYVEGARLRIGIPFLGEAALFRYGTSPYNSPIEGNVDDEEHLVLLSYQAEHPDPAVVKQDFDNRIGQISNTLDMVRGHTTEWNERELPNLVRNHLSERRTKLAKNQNLSLGYPMAPAPFVDEPRATPRSKRHDLFLSHASEDKDAIARPLYTALTKAGISVWFDEAELHLGDSLRRKIDQGLAECRYGVVILSTSFFAKDWPQRELDGLVARETASGQKAILPIWHQLQRAEVAKYSPTLADRVAGRSDEGIAALVRKISQVLGK